MSEDTLVFYHAAPSRSSIVHWMLEEVGAPYHVELLDFERGEHKRPEVLAINPMGKVPAIVHRGTVVTEVAAICAYLADAFPAAKLAPSVTEPSRGTYFRCLFVAAGCIEPALTDKAFPRVSAARPSALGYGTYDDVLHTMEKLIGAGPYVLG